MLLKYLRISGEGRYWKLAFPFLSLTNKAYKECRLLRLCAILLLEDELCFPGASLHGAWLCAHFCGWGIWEIQMWRITPASSQKEHWLFPHSWVNHGWTPLYLVCNPQKKGRHKKAVISQQSFVCDITSTINLLRVAEVGLVEHRTCEKCL